MKYYDPIIYVRLSSEMSYKHEYEPSELFCDHSKRWVRLTKDLKRILDDSPASALTHLPLVRNPFLRISRWNAKTCEKSKR